MYTANISCEREKQLEQGELLGPKTGATNYHAQLGHPDKGLAIKKLVAYRKFNEGKKHANYIKKDLIRDTSE